MRNLLIVSYPGDKLSDAVERQSERVSMPVHKVHPNDLPDALLTVKDGSFFFNRNRVGAVLSRCPPKSFLSAKFADEDQDFSNAEVRALWLDALLMPSVFAVNRLDPIPFFDDSEWITWRYRLARAGVPVSPFSFGNIADIQSNLLWLPHRSISLRNAPDPLMQRVIGGALTTSHISKRYFYVGDTILTDNPPQVMKAAQNVLIEGGLRMAEVVLDERQRVLTINPYPDFAKPERAADILVKDFYDHLCVC